MILNASMSDHNSLISVIIATYNRQDLLPKSLDSILAQTYRNFEIIIVDDASPDDTRSVVADYQKHYDNIRYFRLETNQGPGAARNHGIQHAKGNYIAIMDDDDVCVQERLEIQLQFMLDNPDVDLCFGLVEWIDKHGEILRRFPGILERDSFPLSSRGVLRYLLLESNKVTNTTVVAKRSVLIDHPYHTQIRTGEDWFAFLHMAASGLCIAGIPRVLVFQDRDPERDGLMRANHIYDDQLHVLQTIITEFNVPKRLEKHALSNYYVRHARASRWDQGFLRLCHAFWLWPTNAFAWRSLYDLFIRGMRRLSPLKNHRQSQSSMDTA